MSRFFLDITLQESVFILIQLMAIKSNDNNHAPELSVQYPCPDNPHTHSTGKRTVTEAKEHTKARVGNTTVRRRQASEAQNNPLLVR